MKKEIVVNSTPNEIRIGIVEDGELVELLGDSADSTRMVGNVYLGKVTAVRPGLQAAFVDIGYEKAGFLHVSDLVHEEPEETKSDNGGERRRGRSREGMRPIERMIREGDQLLVQVVKEALGTKGPRLTADISLPGRFLVLMPKGKHVGVSRKIGDRQERARLKAMLTSVRPDKGAFIIRTAGEGIDEKMLRKDVEYLTSTLQKIEERAKEVTAPAIVHEDVGLIVGLIRDVLTEDVDAVHIDNEVDYRRLVEYVKTFSPKLLNRIKLYRGDVSLFDKFDIESELKRSLERKVWMKKGGYIVIDQTEALVAIDVNTGRFTGKRNQEETIFKTNMMAAREVPRQLRLRNIGGIVVIDFIDMENEANKRKVLNELRTYLKRDRARTKTFTISDLGLVEMSRQRVRESLQSRLSDTCPFCKGSGYILSLDTLANRVERLLAKCGLTTRETAIQVQANPSLAVHLLTDRGAAIEKIARDFNMKIDILDDARIHREDFRIVSLRSRKDLTSQLESASWKGAVTRRSSAAAQAGGSDSRESSDRRGRGGRSRNAEAGRGGRDEGRRESPSRSGRREESRSASDTRRSQGGRRSTAREESPEREGRPVSGGREGRTAESSGGRRSSTSRGRRSDSRPTRSGAAPDTASAPPRSQSSAAGGDDATKASEDRSPAPVGTGEEGSRSTSSTRRRRGRRGRRGRGRGRSKSSEEAAVAGGSESSGSRAEATGAQATGAGEKEDASPTAAAGMQKDQGSSRAPSGPATDTAESGGPAADPGRADEVPTSSERSSRTRRRRVPSSRGRSRPTGRSEAPERPESADRPEAPERPRSTPRPESTDRPEAPERPGPVSQPSPPPVDPTPARPEPSGAGSGEADRPPSASRAVESTTGPAASSEEKPRRRGRRPRRVVRR